MPLIRRYGAFQCKPANSGYYGDFFIYPVLIAIVTLCALIETKGLKLAEWLLFFLIGIAAWTVAEYFLHRAAFHHFPIIKQLHDAHHVAPKALIGSPTWLSVAIASSIFALLSWTTGLIVSSAISTGLMLGYLCYITVHHLNHHAKPTCGTYLYWTKRRHALHHYRDRTKNYGVTTNVWDRLFGTEYEC